MPPTPSITIAICTWNRCALLRQTLERLLEIVHPRDVVWDVLVVNNNCTDATSLVVADFKGRLQIREVLEPKSGLSHARNRALGEVVNDYIVWIDDDVLVDEGWLVAAVEAIRRSPDVVAFGGPIEPWFIEEPDPQLVVAFPDLRRGFCALDYGPEERFLRNTQPLFGANMAFAMMAVRDLQFNPSLGTVSGSGFGGEELEFLNQVQRRNGRILWIPAMRVRHYVDPFRMTLEYLTKFCHDRGRTFIRMGRPVSEPQLLGLPRWIWPLLVRAMARYWFWRLTPFRQQELMALGEYSRFSGMFAESRVRRTNRTRARIRE